MLVLRANIDARRWDKDAPNLEHLREDDVPSDVLGDFKTRDNMLSLFLVDNAEAMLRRTIVALACTRDSVQANDYAFLDLEKFKTSGLELILDPSSASTPDDDVNSQHCNVNVLTGLRLVDLAKVFWHNAVIDGIAEKEMWGLIDQGKGNSLDPKRINKKLMERLNQRS